MTARALISLATYQTRFQVLDSLTSTAFFILWIHDLWYPLMPLDTFMKAIGAEVVEYPAETP